MTARMLDGIQVSSGGRTFTYNDDPPDEDGHGARWYTCNACETTIRGGSDALADHECPPACPECGQRDEDARTEPGTDGYLIWQCCGQEAHCPCGSVTSTNHRSVCTAWITP